ncbi:hypothetical protein H2201_008098 [Coniosporium apollinis]|uniref:DUF8004 domain-containing protein n=1 Tax=Coniosporium apollinis TaxID=61459 RepID=A0ABQ9NJY4_9PEZI|nr:hypothetical protein H2201_008098 [Coniosporium apollinis]
MLMSAGASDAGSPSGLTYRDPDRLDYSVWFQAPAHVKAQRDVHELTYRHNIATRNFIALLYGKPMVGRELYEMLSDLRSAMETFFELNPEDQRPDITRIIVQYLLDRKLDDTSNDMGAALGLLRWCEQPHVMWEQGYLEAFVHCTGMMSEPVMQTDQFRTLSRVTRHNLETAYTALQLKLIHAEERLATFDFVEIWKAQSVVTNHPACKAFSAFRKFLTEFYGSTHGVWPPQPGPSGRWLNRRIAQRLQQDFGAVYDYLIDRDIVWCGNEARPNRKWEMISRVPRPDVFRADSPSLPVTDMLVSFDSRHKYEHLPRPYPLLPQDVQPSAKAQLAKKTNDLVDALSRHEKALDLRNVAPQDARIGRWILVYGILQVLSTLSVDAHGLQHASDDIDYFLNPALAGCPPWRKPVSQSLPGMVLEATQRDSYCWRAVERWEQAEEQGGLRLEMAEGRDVVSELDGRSLVRPSLVEKMYAADLDGEEDVKPEVPKRSPRRLWAGKESGKGNVQGYFAEENGTAYC